MVFFNVKSAFAQTPVIRMCLDYVSSPEAVITPGTRRELAPGVSLIFSEFTPAGAKDRPWEAHRAYADLHIPLLGAEILHIADVSAMRPGVYQPEKDFLPLEGEKGTELYLTPGYAALLLPEDAHKTGIAPWDAPEGNRVCKAVAKISLEAYPQLGRF